MSVHSLHFGQPASHRDKKPKLHTGPALTILHKTPTGETRRTLAQWTGTTSAAALAQWVSTYSRSFQPGQRSAYVARALGYLPLPYFASLRSSEATYEWVDNTRKIVSPIARAESLVTARPLIGRGGIREAAPSTPASGDSSWPADVATRYPGSPAVNDAGTPGDFGADQGQPVAPGT